MYIYTCINIYDFKYSYIQTITSKVDEENNGRLRLVDLKAKEKELRGRYPFKYMNTYK
jgi:hypothetical protein